MKTIFELTDAAIERPPITHPEKNVFYMIKNTKIRGIGHLSHNGKEFWDGGGFRCWDINEVQWLKRVDHD